MPETFAGALVQRRCETKMSLRQLGILLGVSFSTLARIERGDGQPNTHTRRCLSAWLWPELPPEPCACARCCPSLSLPSLKDVEERLAALEQRLSRHIHEEHGA